MRAYLGVKSIHYPRDFGLRTHKCALQDTVLLICLRVTGENHQHICRKQNPVSSSQKYHRVAENCIFETAPAGPSLYYFRDLFQYAIFWNAEGVGPPSVYIAFVSN